MFYLPIDGYRYAWPSIYQNVSPITTLTSLIPIFYIPKNYITIIIHYITHNTLRNEMVLVALVISPCSTSLVITFIKILTCFINLITIDVVLLLFFMQHVFFSFRLVLHFYNWNHNFIYMLIVNLLQKWHSTFLPLKSSNN
jgi:hypothetical protein